VAVFLSIFFEHFQTFQKNKFHFFGGSYAVEFDTPLCPVPSFLTLLGRSGTIHTAVCFGCLGSESYVDFCRVETHRGRFCGYR